jgi:hypothetical protein
VLLLDQGRSYRDIAEWTLASNDSIAMCVRKYREGGVPALLQGESPAPVAFPLWLIRVVEWLMTKTPQTLVTSEAAGRVKCSLRCWPGRPERGRENERGGDFEVDARRLPPRGGPVLWYLHAKN